MGALDFRALGGIGAEGTRLGGPGCPGRFVDMVGIDVDVRVKE